MSQCLNNTAVPGCYNDPVNGPTSVTIHYVYDNEGAPAVRITDTAGVVVAAATAANTTPGACALPSPAFEQNELCDIQADGSSIPFVRRTLASVDGLGVVTTTVTDLELDYLTPYTVTGTVGNCPTCAELAARGLQTAW